MVNCHLGSETINALKQTCVHYSCLFPDSGPNFTICKRCENFKISLLLHITSLFKIRVSMRENLFCNQRTHKMVIAGCKQIRAQHFQVNSTQTFLFKLGFYFIRQWLQPVILFGIYVRVGFWYLKTLNTHIKHNSYWL